MSSKSPFKYIESGPVGVSSWVAYCHDGIVLSSAFDHTYAELRAAKPRAIALHRGGDEKVLVAIPDGMLPYFLRRGECPINMDGSSAAESHEWGSFVGWEDPAGNLFLACLLHDGRVLLTNTTDVVD